MKLTFLPDSLIHASLRITNNCNGTESQSHMNDWPQSVNTSAACCTQHPLPSSKRQVSGSPCPVSRSLHIFDFKTALGGRHDKWPWWGGRQGASFGRVKRLHVTVLCSEGQSRKRSQRQSLLKQMTAGFKLAHAFYPARHHTLGSS